ncbi:MAG: aminotransferase class I/II-fold pyridoxal phosphate-dependent enzyme [Clostridia bacterium]|nr:aminotransferase class I/II-fold pyridoxal phosphate-dependent enzyme [Clostridia bacterium]
MWRYIKVKYNENFSRLNREYVFSKTANAENGKTINLGIGDVRLPLFRCGTDKMHEAVEEMKDENTFKGYSATGGYGFLRQKIADLYAKKYVSFTEDEIFITDGAKSELGNILELFDNGVKVLFPTPCYPAGVEANLLRGNEVGFLPADENDGFIFYPDYSKKYDIIFLCSPCNPTGVALSKDVLKLWVDYALKNGSVIVYDNAYSVFSPKGYPTTVYEVKDAKYCAVEINSFSKSLGFTGIRCGYTVVPKELDELGKLYVRRLGARYNGTCYIAQKGASAVFGEEGKNEVKKRVNYYKDNVGCFKCALDKIGLHYVNSNASPYLYVKSPKGFTSEEFCYFLMKTQNVTVTPDTAFYSKDCKYFRISGFGDRKTVLEATDRISRLKF